MATTLAVKMAATVAALDAADGAERLRAVRSVKNAVIGNPSRKEAYARLGAVERLARAFQEELYKLKDKVRDLGLPLRGWLSFFMLCDEKCS